jgi:glycosyltransferase involved in cell wall biosynthesis
MFFWVISVSDRFHPDEKKFGRRRSAIIVEALLDAGHKVKVFSSSFIHQEKKNRQHINDPIRVNKNYVIQYIKTTSYKNNISIKRVISYLLFSIKLYLIIKNQKRPDFIFITYPPISSAFFLVRYSKKFNIPSVLDIRDPWPESFFRNGLFNACIEVLLKLFVKPVLDNISSFSIRNTFALTTTTLFNLKYYQKKADRKNIENDRVFFLFYKKQKDNKQNIETIMNSYKSKYIIEKNDFLICFIGKIERDTILDLKTVIDSSIYLSRRYKNIKTVICGGGKILNFYKLYAENCKNIIFTGWINKLEISSIMRLSSVGLIPYKNTFGFRDTIPTKAGEYLSEGLPILTSLKGHINNVLNPYNCIFYYREGSTENLIKQILYIYNNFDQLSFIKKQALKAYDDLFDAEKEYPKMVRYFEKIARSTKH